MGPRQLKLFGLGCLISCVGCFAPFSWPEAWRNPAESQPQLHTSAKTTELPVATESADPIDNPEPEAAESEATFDSTIAEDALAKAAEHLDRDENREALPYLRAYVKANPDAVMIRAYLAELYLRLGETENASREFHTVIDIAETMSGPIRDHRVHCHTRLMEMAQADGDDFAEYLNRGIGLYLLVKRWDAEPGRSDEIVAEQTLSQALQAFREAEKYDSSDPRPQLWRAKVLDRLGQGAAADTARQRAITLQDRSEPYSTDWARYRFESALAARPR